MEMVSRILRVVLAGQFVLTAVVFFFSARTLLREHRRSHGTGRTITGMIVLLVGLLGLTFTLPNFINVETREVLGLVVSAICTIVGPMLCFRRLAALQSKGSATTE